MDRHAGDLEYAPELAPQRPAERDEQAGAPALAAATGNRGFGDLIARSGAGILPGGTVHPDVVSAIASTRGTGHSVPDGVRETVSPHIGDPLDDVRLHTDSTADSLARSVDARAFATGTDVYFAAGEYQPHSSSGQELLAHELTHVAQQRGARAGGPMTVSNPGDALETEADDVARDALR